MRRQLDRVIPGALACLAVSASALCAETVTIVADRDNSVFSEDLTSLSNGQGAFLFTGSTGDNFLRRALVRFDIAAHVPAGATIDAATLTLNMSRTRSVTGRVTTLHKLTADWGEAGSNATSREGRGAPAQTGDATWVHRFFDTLTWANPGGDFVALASAQQTVGAVGPYSWGSTPEMVADVQEWLDTPASNFGWILVGTEINLRTAKRFDSRENGFAPNRPQLVVDFTDITPVEAHSWGAVKALFRRSR